MGINIPSSVIAQWGAIPAAVIAAAHWLEKKSSDQRFVLAAKMIHYIPMAYYLAGSVNSLLHDLILDYGMLSPAERALPWKRNASFGGRYLHASKLADKLTLHCIAMFVAFTLIMHGLQKLAHKHRYTKLETGLNYAEKVVTTAMKVTNFAMTFIGFMCACETLNVPLLGFYLLSLASYIPPALVKRAYQTAHVAIFGLK